VVHCHDHYNSIGQFSAENFNDAFSENYSLWLKPIYSIAEALRISKTAIQTALQMFYLGDP
jgi:hypothetical protein